MKNFIIAVLTLAILNAAASANTEIDLIVFGSCADERSAQPIWQAINDEQGDLFLFIGDNQYADKHLVNGKFKMKPVSSIDRFKEAYTDLASKLGFQELRSTTPIMATWDDHDYGANDGGKHFPLKRQSQRAFLDFFGYEQNHPLRKQAGIYHAKVVGEFGKRVQVIMLDTRFHRDDLVPKPLEHMPGRYAPSSDPSLAFLGEAQWRWLEKQLLVPAELRIIVSSVQVVAYQHGWESWGNFPFERQRLYQLIRQTKANGVVFLSGDRHLTELSVDTGQLGASVPYPMWDFTSSGLTQKTSPVVEENIFRQGDVFRTTNYGLVRVNWQSNMKDTQLEFVAKGKDGQPLLHHTILLSELVVDN